MTAALWAISIMFYICIGFFIAYLLIDNPFKGIQFRLVPIWPILFLFIIIKELIYYFKRKLN